MERIELLARTEGMAVAGTREKWIGRAQFVRFADGREAALVVTEHRTREVSWLIARER